jgi:hypothetical protein
MMNSKKTEDKGPFISCVSLSGDETYDVEQPQSLHANQTAEEAADQMKTSGKCVDAWVNDAGHGILESFCYLFGSYAKGKAKPTSDVDFLISADVRGLEFYGLVEEILKDGIKIYG